MQHFIAVHYFTTLKHAALDCTALLQYTVTSSSALYWTLNNAELFCTAFLHYNEACSTAQVPGLLTLFCSSRLIGSTQAKILLPKHLVGCTAWNYDIMPISFSVSAVLVKCVVELEPEIELVLAHPHTRANIL